MPPSAQNITVSQGVRGTGILTTEDRRVRDVTPELAQLEPDAGPLTTLLARLRSRSASDPRIEWYEDSLLPDFDILGAALNGTGTVMTVTNFRYFRAGDLVLVNNAEIVRVSTTPTTTAVTIARAVGTVAAVAAGNGSSLFILSDSNEEGSATRNLLTTQKINAYNFTQIMKTPIGFTGTAMATDTFAGQDKMIERAKALIEHKKKLEKMFHWGQRSEVTTGTHPQRTSAGVLSFIATNVQDAGGGLTEPILEDFLRVCFRYGSREKVLECSPKAITLINSFGRAKLETRQDESTYGVTMTQYHNAGRKLMLVEQVLFSNASLNDLTGIAGYALLLDVQDLEMRYLKGRMTRLEQNIQNNDIDGETDQYISEVGLEVHLEKKHGLLTGCSA